MQLNRSRIRRILLALQCSLACFLAPHTSFSREPDTPPHPEILKKFNEETAVLNLSFQPDQIVRDILLDEHNELYYLPLAKPQPLRSKALETWLSATTKRPERMNGIRPGDFLKAPYFLTTIDVQRVEMLFPKGAYSTDVRWVLANEAAIKSSAAANYAVGAAFMHVKFRSPGVIKDATIFTKFTDGWHGLDLTAIRDYLERTPKPSSEVLTRQENPESCMKCHQLKKDNDYITTKRLNHYDLATFANSLEVQRRSVSSLKEEEFDPVRLQMLLDHNVKDVCYSNVAIDRYGSDPRLLWKYAAICKERMGDIPAVFRGGMDVLWMDQQFVD